MQYRYQRDNYRLLPSDVRHDQRRAIVSLRLSRLRRPFNADWRRFLVEKFGFAVCICLCLSVVAVDAQPEVSVPITATDVQRAIVYVERNVHGSRASEVRCTGCQFGMCAVSCLSTDTCAGFDFLSDTLTCYIHSVDTVCRPLVQRSNATHYRRVHCNLGNKQGRNDSTPTQVTAAATTTTDVPVSSTDSKVSTDALPKLTTGNITSVSATLNGTVELQTKSADVNIPATTVKIDNINENGKLAGNEPISSTSTSATPTAQQLPAVTANTIASAFAWIAAVNGSGIGVKNVVSGDTVAEKTGILPIATTAYQKGQELPTTSSSMPISDTHPTVVSSSVAGVTAASPVTIVSLELGSKLDNVTEKATTLPTSGVTIASANAPTVASLSESAFRRLNMLTSIAKATRESMSLATFSELARSLLTDVSPEAVNELILTKQRLDLASSIEALTRGQLNSSATSSPAAGTPQTSAQLPVNISNGIPTAAATATASKTETGSLSDDGGKTSAARTKLFEAGLLSVSTQPTSGSQTTTTSSSPVVISEQLSMSTAPPVRSPLVTGSYFSLDQQAIVDLIANIVVNQRRATTTTNQAAAAATPTSKSSPSTTSSASTTAAKSRRGTTSTTATVTTPTAPTVTRATLSKGTTAATTTVAEPVEDYDASTVEPPVPISDDVDEEAEEPEADQEMVTTVTPSTIRVSTAAVRRVQTSTPARAALNKAKVKAKLSLPPRQVARSNNIPGKGKKRLHSPVGRSGVVADSPAEDSASGSSAPTVNADATVNTTNPHGSLKASVMPAVWAEELATEHAPNNAGAFYDVIEGNHNELPLANGITAVNAGSQPVAHTSPATGVDSPVLVFPVPTRIPRGWVAYPDYHITGSAYVISNVGGGDKCVQHCADGKRPCYAVDYDSLKDYCWIYDNVADSCAPLIANVYAYHVKAAPCQPSSPNVKGGGGGRRT